MMILFFFFSFARNLDASLFFLVLRILLSEAVIIIFAFSMRKSMSETIIWRTSVAKTPKSIRIEEGKKNEIRFGAD